QKKDITIRRIFFKYDRRLLGDLLGLEPIFRNRGRGTPGPRSHRRHPDIRGPDQFPPAFSFFPV
ncbi:MAG: hypothetical protein NTY16_11230, partial [Deltaproteobacteria bacterium]|nr:hypothetical protein [Deltaproteobacteria bacterium]